MAGGAPVGNQNAAKGKRWADAIDRALAARSKVEGIQALDALAEKLLTLADEGDLGALKELGDRLDGKAAQSIEQKTELTASVEMSNRPQLTKEEWLAAHGLGSAGG